MVPLKEKQNMKKLLIVLLIAMTFLAISTPTFSQGRCGYDNTWSVNYNHSGYSSGTGYGYGYNNSCGYGNSYIAACPVYIQPAPAYYYAPQPACPVTTGRWVKEITKETRPVQSTCIDNNGNTYQCTVMKEITTEKWVYYP